jgi:oligosaccharide repeat unit polymerase
VIVTLGSRVRCGSWFAPAAFVGLVWSFFTGVSLLVVDYPVPGRGLWMLVFLIIAIQLGALIAHELQPPTRPAGNNELDSLIVPCRRHGLLCTAIALVGCVYFLFTSLTDFGLPFTPLGVLEVGAKWTRLRYDDAVEPWSVRLLVTWVHPAGLLGGVLFACSRRRLDRAIGLMTLLPAVVYGILTGARAAILLGLTCWIGGYVATRCVRNHGRLAMFTAKRLALLLFTALSMVGVFGGIDAVRDSSSLQAFVFGVQGQKLSNYIFGPPAAFADWYAHADVSGAEWGARTFAGEFDVLHFRTRTVGRYTETSNVVGTEVTNVYTLFRGLIEDFTVFGAVLIAACIGGFAGRVYTGPGNARHTLFWLSAFFAAFLYSPIVSLFSFNGAALAWAVGWLVLVRVKRQRSFYLLPRLTDRKATTL